MALPPDVIGMLCWGTDQPPHPSAAEALGGRPNRILSPKELAEYLDLERAELDTLMAIEGFHSNKPTCDGFDMDEVLGLERVLRSMPTVEAADVLFGWPGVTDELVRMNLLTALRRVDGSRGIHPHTISQLLDLVRERVDSSPTSAGSTPLRCAIELGFDARLFAWSIAQVVGGSLQATDWQAPFNLVSLQVCERRLRELAKWPHVEPSASLYGDGWKTTGGRP